MEEIVKKRGRPTGFELSDESKDKIRQSRIGKAHSRETRNKISRSLIKYFKKRDPVSDGLSSEYKYFPREITNWLYEHKSELDGTDNIMSNKRIMYLSQLEVCYGSNIENFCHSSTPEFLLLLKEELEDSNMTDEVQELLSLLI
jgi:hypothetical protein